MCVVFSICTHRCHVDMIYYYSFYFRIGCDISKYIPIWHGQKERGLTGGGHTHRKYNSSCRHHISTYMPKRNEMKLSIAIIFN